MRRRRHAVELGLANEDTRAGRHGDGLVVNEDRRLALREEQDRFREIVAMGLRGVARVHAHEVGADLLFDGRVARHLQDVENVVQFALEVRVHALGHCLSPG